MHIYRAFSMFGKSIVLTVWKLFTKRVGCIYRSKGHFSLAIRYNRVFCGKLQHLLGDGIESQR